MSAFANKHLEMPKTDLFPEMIIDQDVVQRLFSNISSI